MKYSLILASFLALSGMSAKAGPRVPFGDGTLPDVMVPYDLDGDGKLNAEERQAFEKAMREERKAELLAKFDANGDGVLDESELKAAREAARQKVEDIRASRFDELDTDDDGLLGADEFLPPGHLPAELVARIFAHLDKDGDGSISKEEFLAGCRGPGGRGGEGGHDGPPRPDNGGELPPPPPPPPAGGR